MKTILLVNGPNLNLLGTREPGVYGATTLADIEHRLAAEAGARGARLEAFQSNAEHELVERVQRLAAEPADFVILNPGAFPHTSVALRDALLAVGTPFHPPPGADLRPSDIALLQYTGGTTGTPKAAMLTHRNLVANSLQARAWFPRSAEGREVFLGAIPFFHVYGLTSVLLFGVAVGAEIVVLPRPRPVDVVLEPLQRFRATLFPGVPTLYAAINDHPRVGEYDLRSGALCVSGAAPLPREVFERFEALTGGRLVAGYGLTETSPFTHCTPRSYGNANQSSGPFTWTCTGRRRNI